MARFLLLHGFGGVGPDHWLVWLSGELRAHGHVARIRKLPSPTAPDLDAWMASMRGRLLALGEAAEPGGMDALDGEKGDPYGDLVVVAHSLGARLWLQHAQEVDLGGDAGSLHYADARKALRHDREAHGFPVADRVALVAPPRLPEAIAPTRFHDLDVAKARPELVGRQTRVVVSGNDPYWPDSGANAGIAAPLGLPVDEVGDHGHLEPADGYGPWPSMLTWCLGEAPEITA